MKMELIEGVDYYIEKGRYVFTAHYLKKRGYCCKSGCRHCPYGFVKPAKEEAADWGSPSKDQEGEGSPSGYSIRM